MALSNIIPHENGLGFMLHNSFISHSERLATDDSSKALTYGMLESCSNAAANMLLSDKDKIPENNVCIIIGSYAERLCAVAGTIKAGMTYVPFDIKAPVQRNVRIAKNVSCSYILTVRENYDYALEIAKGADCPAENIKILSADELLKGDISFPAVIRRPENRAYIIHTSGSTGLPKGVIINDCALVNFLLSVNERYAHITENDHTCALQNFSFDASVFDMFPFMLFGAAIHFIPDELKTDVDSINRFLIEKGVTMQQFTTALYHLFADLENDTLRKVFVIGEKMLKYVPRGYEVYNTYGPTEATVLVTYKLVTEQADNIPIGEPIDNTDIIIVREDGTEAAPGEQGELCIGGICLAEGYLNNPEETEKRFVTHIKDPARRMYRTGDIGMFTESGELLCFGRIDFQIKHRGYRIELDEIKHYILELEEISDCAVLYNDRTENKYIVCFYCTHDGKDIAPGDFRRRLEDSIAEYMIPTHWIRLDSIPMNNNGKTDRNALFAILEDITSVNQAEEDDGTAGKLRSLWAELLDIPADFDENDSFGNLGGHSILSMIMLRRVKDDLGISVTFPELLSCTSFREFAELAESKCTETEALGIYQKDPAHRFDSFSLSVMQQAYYVGRCEGISLGSIPTHLYLELDCFSFDREKFVRTANKLLERHDALRLRVFDDGTQRVLPYSPMTADDIPYSDIRAMSSEEQSALILSSRKELVSQSCDYTSSSLINLRLFQDSSDHALVQLYLDGFVADGWSQEILFSDFDILYCDENAVLPPQEHLFRDYVLFCLSEKRAASEKHAAGERFWKENINALPDIPELPLMADPQLVMKPDVKHIMRVMLPDEWDRFEKSCAAAGVSTSNAMMTVFGKVIARWSRKKDLVINLPVASRFFDEADFTDLFGICTDFLLFDIHERRGETIKTAALRNQERLAELSTYRQFSGIEVIRELSRIRGDAGNAAPVVFTSLLDIPDKDTKFIRKRYFQTHTSQIWLDAIVLKCGDGITFSWDYAGQLFEDVTITAMMDTFFLELRKLAGNQSEWERNELEIISSVPMEISSCAGEKTDTDFAPLVPELIEIADIFSECIAVCAGGEEYTYSQLFTDSKAFAAMLTENGISPGDKVLILMDKRYEQIVSVLGTVLCGGVYVPVDSENTRSRIIHCISDSGAAAVVTETRLLEKYGGAFDVRTINVDTDDIFSAVTEYVQPSATCDDLYCMIYTSGTTGVPKGVMLNQRALQNCVEATTKLHPEGDPTRVLSLTNLCHDMSIYDIFGILQTGGAIILPDEDKLKDPVHWAELIERYSVNFWNSVPSIMEMLLESHSHGGDADISSLRTVILGGEKLSTNMPSRIYALAPQADIYNVGGPTETTVWSIYHKVAPEDLEKVRIPLGKPIENVTYTILDSNLQLCPYDVPGTICVEGISLSNGYLGLPDKTAESFINDPYTGEKMYITGDIGKYLRNGEIDILGRDDDQIKLNGKRIELTEIEAAAVRDKRISAAAAVCDSEKKLIYLYYTANTAITAKELEEHLETELPAYMVPSAYMELEKFPLSRTGKIDRKALPEFDMKAVIKDAQTDDLFPEVLAVYRDILGRDDITSDDNFFRCGGDSLKAIRLLYELNEKTGVQLQLTDIFEFPVIRNMQKHILEF